MDIQELNRRGYCVISRKYGMVSRIDRLDWKEAMAHKHSPWDESEGLEWVNLIGETAAEDHYRRVYSNDKLEPGDLGLTIQDVVNGIPNSNGTRTGYVDVQTN